MENKHPPLAVIGALCVIALFIALQGIIFASLWHWYVAPLGVPSVGYVQALMILLMGRLVVFRANIEEERKVTMEKVARGLATWLFVWGLGFCLLPFV